MNYIVIENHGEADVLALTLMGASTKRDNDGMIGMFGTGFKNAISILLRNQVEIVAFFGHTKITFSTKLVPFRDKSFSRIIVNVDGNPIETGFTTDMGLRWEIDGALRELISNALDEPNPVVTAWNDAPSGVAGRTRVFVEMKNPVKEFYSQAGKHFLKLREDCKPCFNFSGGSIWPKYDSNRVHLYRRGVMVYQSEIPGCYDYEFDTITIDEERKANEWNANYELGHNVDRFPLAAKAVIVTALSRETFEGKCSCIGSLSHEDWKTIFAGKMACSASVMDGPQSAYIDRRTAVRVSETWETSLAGAGVKTSAQLMMARQSPSGNAVEATPIEEQGLSWAVAFLGRFGFSITRGEIHIFVSQDTRMGEWDPVERKIYIARQCLNRGRRYLLVTLLEEIAHRESGANDFTRAFQDYAFEQLANSLERESGEYL